MPRLRVEERQTFWRNFDRRYYAVHPNLRPMRKVLWEIPHWVTWLGGVLAQEGFDSLEALDLYTVDCAVPGGVDEAKVSTIVAQHQADVFLFSPMTPNLPQALHIADIVKRHYPASTTVFGGVVATPLCEDIARHPSVDYVVFGRGEYALPGLLRALRARSDVNGMGNLAYKMSSNGGVAVSQDIHPPIPVGDMPFPKIDIFPQATGNDIRYFRQVYGMGCPYRCPFCTIQTIGANPSYFPIERVVSEIRAYKAHFGQHHHIYFGDETFTLNPKRTIELCSALRAEGGIEYDCQTRMNCLTAGRLLTALRNSGCVWIEIGIETANQESQNLYKQRTKLSDIETALANLRDHGLPACSFMINGFPNQTLDDMRRSVDWACSLIDRGLLHASYLFGLVPYPGTLMYSSPERFGMTLHHRIFDLYNEDLLPVYDTPFATSEQIYDVLLEGVTTLGEVMGHKPYLGNGAHVDEGQLGAFWQDAHG